MLLRVDRKPVRNIARLRQVRKADYPDALGDSVQRLRGLYRMLTSGHVVVFKDKNIASGERQGAVGRPYAAGDRGRAETKRPDVVGVLFALGHKNAAVRIFSKVREPIRDAADALEHLGGDPAAATVWP